MSESVFISDSDIDSNVQGIPIALMPVQDLTDLILGAGYKSENIGGLFTRAGIPKRFLAETDSFFDPIHVWKLVSFLGYELDDELVGCCSRKIGGGTTELVLSRVLRCATLGEAIDVFCDSLNLVFPDILVSSSRSCDELQFSMRFPGLQTKEQQLVLEILCLPYHAIFRWISKSYFNVKGVKTAAARSSSTTNLLNLFGCTVEYEAEGVQLAYSRDIESLPVRASRLDAWRAEIYQVFMDDLESHKDKMVSSNLQVHVERALRSGVTSQEQIASSVWMSVATLRRKLSQEGVSFRRLSDKVFSENCHGYLKAGFTVEEISRKLGYTDPSNFRRAFRRVFGRTPSEYRQ